MSERDHQRVTKMVVGLATQPMKSVYGLVLSGEEEEKANLIAVRNYLKDSFAASGAKFFPAMADEIVRANGHTYSFRDAGWALGKHLLWEGGAALCQTTRGVEGLHPCRLSSDLLWCQG